MKLLKELLNIIDTLIFPLKLIIPQPLIKKIPGLSSNEDLRFRAVLKYMTGHLLDVGCGDNKLVKSYNAQGGKGIGVDVYPWEGVDKLVERTDQLLFVENSFDTVTFVASLNHIPNRIDVLKEVRRVMKPSGKLLITMPTPFISFVWHKWAWWDKDQHERGMKEGEVYGFTEREMVDLLSSTGFTDVKIEKFMWKMNRLYVCHPNKNGK